MTNSDNATTRRDDEEFVMVPTWQMVLRTAHRRALEEQKTIDATIDPEGTVRRGPA